MMIKVQMLIFPQRRQMSLKKITCGAIFRHSQATLKMKLIYV